MNATKLMKNVKTLGTPIGMAYTASAVAGLYLFYKGQLAMIGLGIGSGLVTYAISRKNLLGSILVGLLVALVAYNVRKVESFEDKKESSGETTTETSEEKKESVDGFSKSKEAPPNNGDRAEFFELGKKYKLPSETDDKGFHLDAGTTFLNAYKSLKPDQIAAMTKDTQELMETQKQLMSTLNTLKPLMQDGKEMMNTFQSYFGKSGLPTGM
jgi:hypothetical protein